jgi:polar amino acid transport system substrate-binding protein
MRTRNFVTAALALVAGFAVSAANAQSFESTIPAKPNFTAKLPASVTGPGVLNFGIRCDYPPFGSMDAAGKNVGIEIDLAKALAYYAFGDASKVSFTCVTSANRIPNLITSKVDILIASMAYTTERSKTVEYVPQLYYTYYVEFLTKANGPANFTALKGKTVSTVIGGVYEPWFKACMPDVKVLGFNTIDQAFDAFQQGRADAIAHDNTVLPGILARTSGNKISDDHIIPGYIGMAVRPGSGELTAWLNEAVVAINNSDFYVKSLARNESRPAAAAALKSAVPFPGNAMPVASESVSPGNSCDLIPTKK